MLKHVYKKSLGEKYYLTPEDVTLENSSDLFCALCGRSVKLLFDGQNWQFQHEPGDVTCTDELEAQNAASQGECEDAAQIVPRFPIRTDPNEGAMGNLAHHRVSPSRTEENVLDILEALVPAMTPPQTPEDKQKLIGRKIDFDENELLEAGTQPVPTPDIELFSASNQLQNAQPSYANNINAQQGSHGDPPDAPAPKLETKFPLSATVDLSALEETDLNDIKAATAPSRSLIDLFRTTAVMPSEPVSMTENLDAITDEQLEAATKYLKEQRIENGVTQCHFQSNVFETNPRDYTRLQKIAIAVMIALILTGAFTVCWLLRSDSKHAPVLSEGLEEPLNPQNALAIDQTSPPDDWPETTLAHPKKTRPDAPTDAPSQPLDTHAIPRKVDSEPPHDQTALSSSDQPLNEMPQDTLLSNTDGAEIPLDGQSPSDTQIAQTQIPDSSDDAVDQTKPPRNEQIQPQAQVDSPKCAKLLDTASSLRNRPEASAKLLGTLPKNENSVCFDEVKDNWLRIQYKGADAYICECATDHISPLPAKVKIAAKQLGVRHAPDGKRIGTFSAGTQMHPVSQNGCWYEVRAKGKDAHNKTRVMHGYINRCYVNVIE